jgi:hypothetical protein
MCKNRKSFSFKCEQCKTSHSYLFTFFAAFPRRQINSFFLQFFIEKLAIAIKVFFYSASHLIIIIMCAISCASNLNEVGAKEKDTRIRNAQLAPSLARVLFTPSDDS